MATPHENQNDAEQKKKAKKAEKRQRKKESKPKYQKKIKRQHAQKKSTGGRAICPNASRTFVAQSI